MKKALAVAVSLILFGVLLVLVAFFASGCDLSGWLGADYVTTPHELSLDFDRISVDVDTADLIFLPSENGVCRVVAYEKEKEKHSVAVKDGVLTVSLEEARAERKWYDYISIGYNQPKITVYLPKDDYAALSVLSDTGDISIPKDFTFGSVALEGSTGDIRVSAAASGALTVTMSTGDIALSDASFGSLSVTSSTGDITLRSVTVGGGITLGQSTGDLYAEGVTAAAFSSTASTGKGSLYELTVLGDVLLKRSTGDLTLVGGTAESLEAKTSTGDLSFDRVVLGARLTLLTDTGEVEIRGSDAAEIGITTDTGDVEATFLTPKIFFAETDAGDIDIRKSTVGGLCTVKTDTGDIELYFLDE